VPDNYLDKNIDLRFRIKVGFDCSRHGLFKMQRELSRFVVSRPTFSFAPAKRGHTILTVDHRTVVGRFRPIGAYLKTCYLVILNKNSYRHNVTSAFLNTRACLRRRQIRTPFAFRQELRTIDGYKSKYSPRADRRWLPLLSCCPVPSTRYRPADWIHPSCTGSCATRRTSDRPSSALVCSRDPLPCLSGVTVTVRSIGIFLYRYYELEQYSTTYNCVHNSLINVITITYQYV